MRLFTQNSNISANFKGRINVYQYLNTIGLPKCCNIFLKHFSIDNNRKIVHLTLITYVSWPNRENTVNLWEFKIFCVTSRKFCYELQKYNFSDEIDWYMFDEGAVILVLNWLPQACLYTPWNVDFLDWNGNFRGFIKISWGQSFKMLIFMSEINRKVSSECTVIFIGILLFYFSSYVCFSHLQNSDIIYTIKWKFLKNREGKSYKKNLKYSVFIDNIPNIFKNICRKLLIILKQR